MTTILTIKSTVLRGETMRTIILTIILLASSLAFGQDIQHAPTAAQCQADIAVWKGENKAHIESLPVHDLIVRAQEMKECVDVLADGKAKGWADEIETAMTVELIYGQHIAHRYLDFLVRHRLEQQMADEDAAGQR
jgi:hypothetical protein